MPTIRKDDANTRTVLKTIVGEVAGLERNFPRDPKAFGSELASLIIKIPAWDRDLLLDELRKTEFGAYVCMSIRSSEFAMSSVEYASKALSGPLNALVMVATNSPYILSMKRDGKLLLEEAEGVLKHVRKSNSVLSKAIAMTAFKEGYVTASGLSRFESEKTYLLKIRTYFNELEPEDIKMLRKDLQHNALGANAMADWAEQFKEEIGGELGKNKGKAAFNKSMQWLEKFQDSLHTVLWPQLAGERGGEERLVEALKELRREKRRTLELLGMA